MSSAEGELKRIKPVKREDSEQGLISREDVERLKKYWIHYCRSGWPDEISLRDRNREYGAILETTRDEWSKVHDEGENKLPTESKIARSEWSNMRDNDATYGVELKIAKASFSQDDDVL